MPSPQVPDRIKEAPAMVLRTIFAGIGQLLMAADKVRAQLQEQLGPPAPHRPAAGQPEAEPQQPAASNVTRLSDRQGPGGQRAHSRPASPSAAATGPALGSAAGSQPAVPATAAAAAPAAARPAPAEPAAAKPAAAKSATAEPAPAKRAPAKPAAVTKPAPAAPAAATATKPAPAKRAPAKPVPAKPVPAKPVPAKPVPAKPVPAKPAAKRTTKLASTKPAPATPAASPPPEPPVAGYDSLSVASLRARLRGLDPDGVRALLAYERATTRRDDVITMYEHRLARLAGETG